MLYVPRLSNQYSYPSQDWQVPMFTPEEQYYREVAEEHRRRAEAAMALAQQERQRALLSRRQQALRRDAPFGYRSPYNPRGRPISCCGGPSMEDMYYAGLLEEQQRRAEELKRKEREEALRRLQFLQGHPESDYVFLPGFVNPLDSDEIPVSLNPAPLKKVRFSPSNDAAEVQAPKQGEAPKLDKGKAKEIEAPEPQPAQSGPHDLWSNLFHALSGGRSPQEKEAILRELGLKLPASATPATAKKPAAKARPASVPPTTRVPVKGVEPTTTPNPTPASPSPAPSSPRHSSFTAIDAIQSQFDALKAAFTFPAHVDFDATGKLTYNSANAPIHQYESELMKLLTKLDGIDSEGAASIRGARKALVMAVEEELENLDAEKKKAWETQSAAKEEAPAVVEVDIVDANTAEPAPAVAEAAAQDAMVVEPITAEPATEPMVVEPVPEVTESPVVSEPAAEEPVHGEEVAQDSVVPEDAMVEEQPSTASAEEPTSYATTALVEPAKDEAAEPTPEEGPEQPMEVEEQDSTPTVPEVTLEPAPAVQDSEQASVERPEEAEPQPPSPTLSTAPSDTEQSSAGIEDSVVVDAPAKVEEIPAQQEESGSEHDFEML